MNISMYVLSIFSFLFLAAHFLRVWDLGTAAVWLMFPLFFTERKGWVRLVLALSLLAGGAIWIHTGYTLVAGRIIQGAPWARLLAIIMIIVSISVIASIMLMGGMARKAFSESQETAIPQAVVFFSVFVILEFIRQIVPLNVIIADRFLPGAGRFEIFLLSVYAAWLAEKMLDPGLSPKYRPKLWIFFSMIFFLQLALGLAGFEKFLMTGKLHLPVPALIISGPIYRLSSFFMPVLFISTILLAGPAWCSYLCYMGSWDALLSVQHKGKVKAAPYWTRKSRIIILILAVIIPLTLRYSGIGPDAGLVMALAFGIGGVIIMMVFSRKMGLMIHCTSYCPVGLAAGLLGKISPWRITIGKECNSCMACTRACRYGALEKVNLKNRKPGITCALCGDCIPSCKNSHIQFHFPGISGSRARVVFISVVIIIHAIFLGVARI